MQKIPGDFQQCLTNLREIGKDSIFYTATTKSVEFYTENPNLSGSNLATPTSCKWSHLQPMKRERLGQTTTMQVSTNHMQPSCFKAPNSPPSPLKFSAKSSRVSSSFSFYLTSFSLHLQPPTTSCILNYQIQLVSHQLEVGFMVLFSKLCNSGC